MKPAPFAVAMPRSIDQAVEVLAQHGDEARVLAGGQSLIPLMALRLASSTVLVDIGRIATLGDLDRSNDAWHIGAAVTQRRVERDVGAVPLVNEAVRSIGHATIRNRGTVLGSLCHADPAAELPAVAVALGATIEARSAGGPREIVAADFFRGYMTTALEPTELAVAVRLPSLPAGIGSAFAEVSRRHGDFAMVGAAAVVGADVDGRVSSARLVLSGVADTPFAVPGLDELLRGRSLDAEALSAASALVVRTVEPGSDLHATAAYRRHLAGVLTERTLRTAWARTGAAVDAA